MYKIIFFFSILFSISCTQLLDDAVEGKLVGSWELVEIKDVATNTTTEISNANTTTKIFGNIPGNAVRFDGSGSDFNVFYQHIGDGVRDGFYDLDIYFLTLNFDNGTVIERTIQSVDDIELTIQDTIASKPKILKFVRT